MPSSSSTPFPPAWRTKLRSTLLDGQGHEEQVAYCLDNNCVAFGWNPAGVSSGRGEGTLELVCSEIENVDDKGWGTRASKQVRAFATEVEPGDYIWIRDTNGRYRLGQFDDGEWSFVSGEDRPDLAALDLHQFRPVTWAPEALDPEDTPGAVVRAFTGQGQAFRRVNNAAWQLTHEYCWPFLNGKEPRFPDLSPEAAVGGLAPYELEDLVLLWLQIVEDYALIPSSRRKDLPVAEATLISRVTGQRARPQVKSGTTPLDWAELGKAVGADEIGVGFAASGTYLGEPQPGWRQLSAAELGEFVTSPEGRSAIPRPIRFWFGG